MTTQKFGTRISETEDGRKHNQRQNNAAMNTKLNQTTVHSRSRCVVIAPSNDVDWRRMRRWFIIIAERGGMNFTG